MRKTNMLQKKVDERHILLNKTCNFVKTKITRNFVKIKLFFLQAEATNTMQNVSIKIILKELGKLIRVNNNLKK